MPLFSVSFTKEMTISVEAETEEELDAVANKLARDGRELDRDWDLEWEYSVSAIPTDIVKKIEHVDCGVAEGKLLDWSDYEERKRA